MNPSRREELRKLAEKASPAPWEPCAHLKEPDIDKICPCHASVRGTIWEGSGEMVVCEIGSTPYGEDEISLPEVGRPTAKINAAFIAASRQAIPDLLDSLEAAESDAAKWKVLVERLGSEAKVEELWAALIRLSQGELTMRDSIDVHVKLKTFGKRLATIPDAPKCGKPIIVTGAAQMSAEALQSGALSEHIGDCTLDLGHEGDCK